MTNQQTGAPARDGQITRHVNVPGVGDPRRFGYAHAVSAAGPVFVADGRPDRPAFRPGLDRPDQGA